MIGFVNEDDLKRPLVPLKVAKASIELHLGTIPSRCGSVRSGPIVIIRLSHFNCNCNCLLELILAAITIAMKVKVERIISWSNIDPFKKYVKKFESELCGLHENDQHFYPICFGGCEIA